MSFETAAQTTVFTALTAALAPRIVYDAAPQLPEGMPDSGFPYAVIGDDTYRPDDADDILGAQVTVTVHYWSRYPGRKQIKEMMGLAYAALNRAALTAVGHKVVDCLCEFSNTPPVEADGKTRHGVHRFRLTLHKE